MKNKRNVLIAFILICCLCLSIGYAALTDTLYVNGAMTIDTDSDTPNNPEKSFDADVYYKDAVVTISGTDVGSKDLVTATIKNDTDGDTNDMLDIVIPAGVLNVKGDTVTVTVNVQNDSQDLAASVVQSSITEGINADFFNVSAYWTELGTEGSNTHTVPANSSKNVTIVIELAKSPTADVTGSFSFNHTATANANDNVQQPATP